MLVSEVSVPSGESSVRNEYCNEFREWSSAGGNPSMSRVCLPFRPQIRTHCSPNGMARNSQKYLEILEQVTVANDGFIAPLIERGAGQNTDPSSLSIVYNTPHLS